MARLRCALSHRWEVDYGYSTARREGGEWRSRLLVELESLVLVVPGDLEDALGKSAKLLEQGGGHIYQRSGGSATHIRSYTRGLTKIGRAATWARIRDGSVCHLSVCCVCDLDVLYGGQLMK